jgi:cation diffusion facilitator family transporter
MHADSHESLHHQHDFNAHNARSAQNEKRTLNVVILTAVMMIFEISGGWIFGSMALLADGWHMGTHAAALGIALFAYWYARKQAHNPRYTFGTGKVSVLGGYSSAIVLQIIAVLMAVQAGERLLNPQPIRYTEAIIVAVVGLAVNLISVRLLDDGGHHHHEHQDHHDHEPHDHSGDDHPSDHNIKAAYFHVLADALTSVLAIAALICGRFFGWNWMDALMGIVGGLVISRWAIGLLRETSQILLDGSANASLEARIRTLIENGTDAHVTDLHIWKIGDQSTAAILALVTPNPQPLAYYRERLSSIHGLAHLTIELNPHPDVPAAGRGKTAA